MKSMKGHMEAKEPNARKKVEIYCCIPSLLFFNFQIKQEEKRKGRKKREEGRKKGAGKESSIERIEGGREKYFRRNGMSPPEILLRLISSLPFCISNTLICRSCEAETYSFLTLKSLSMYFF